MKLETFYDSIKVPKDVRIPLERNVLLVVPAKDYAIGPFLAAAGLVKQEVAVTWPKEGVPLVEEVAAASPAIVVQLGTRVSRRYPFVADGEPISAELKERIAAATFDFANLHHHDEYSQKDGLGSVNDLVKLLLKQRRTFCAVTNHGSIGGWIKQYNACKKSGLKAIFGMEAYVSNYRGEDMEQKKLHRSANHLVLLARTKEGWDNIIRIHNDAQLNGFYYTPRMNWDAARQWGKGIVGTSACMAGEIAQALMQDRKADALAAWEVYSKAFDCFYIELHIIEYELQREANRRLIQFAREVGAPLILACDSHYLDPEYAETHDLLMYIRQGKTRLEKVEKDEDIWDFEVRNLYYRTAEQMHRGFAEPFDSGGKQCPAFLDEVFTEDVFREALANTMKVAREAEDIKLDGKVHLPKLYEDSREELRGKVNAGFTRLKLGQFPNAADYKARLKYEFEVICKLGWADYFLVMERIVTMAKTEFASEVGEWAIGYGRGSAAGCLVSWCLGLTYCDPLEHGLLFERFLDEGRPDPPDIDTDFHPAIRDRVKTRIVEMFGADKTCSIGTYTTYKTRAVIIDVARALGLDVMEVNTVTKEMDPLKAFEDDDGEDVIVDKMDFDELRKHYPKLDAYLAKNPEVEVHAAVIRNQVKNMGKHAGGVIISDMDLRDRIPVQRGGDGGVVSSWAESGNTSELSQVGLVKYDILGLNNLPIVSDCVKLIERYKGEKIARDDIPVDDQKAIRMEARDTLTGIFQLENSNMKSTIDAVGMESLNDVSAITSLIRPGPRDMGMDMEYAARKNGKPYEILPVLKPVLGNTYGILVYQEQMMKIAQVLCGFDGPMANKLRKACGKKIMELMVSIREAFVKGAQPKIDAGDVTLAQVEELWDNIVSFAKYGFNKSHAVTYSMLTTAELWLKHNYFVEYMTALINNTKAGKKKHGSSDIRSDYINYVRRRGTEVLCPDINLSETAFTIEYGGVRYGLSGVRNVASAATNICRIAREKPFESMADFYERCVYEQEVQSGKNAGKIRKTRPSKEVVESLIAAGAFDKFGTRQKMLDEYYAARKKKETAAQLSEDEWEQAEREAIGLCLSKPPLFVRYDKEMTANNWRKLNDIEGRKKVTVLCRVEHIIPKTSKAGNPMLVVEVTDGMDNMTFFVFMAGKQQFLDHVKAGNIAAIPLDKFEDGDTRFYDDRREIVVVER